MTPPSSSSSMGVRPSATHEDVAELSSTDLELLGRICDELRGEEQAGGDVDMEDANEGKEGKTADELRREKNRLKRLMNDLRRQVALLETQLRHLQLSAAHCQQLQGHPHHRQPATALAPSGSAARDGGEAPGWQAKLEVLAELERVRAQLERENRALRHCVAFRDACRSSPREQQQKQQQCGRKGVPRPLPPPSFLVVRPLVSREVLTLRKQLRAQVAAFLLGHDRVFSRLGSVRGWDAERGVDAGLFKFLLRRRRIPDARPEMLLRATWALLTDDRRFRALFSAKLGIACNVLQPIDGDNALALMQYSGRAVSTRVAGEKEQQGEEEDERGGARTVKTLYVVAKFSEPQDAHMIVLRGVERRPLVIKSLSTVGGDQGQANNNFSSRTPPGDDLSAADAPEEEWSYLFTWLRFERTDDGSALTFGGAVPTLDARSPFWLLELLPIALRWEKAVLTQA